MHNVIPEIIDDNLNTSVLICENQNIYGKLIANRGMRVVKCAFTKDFPHPGIEVDAALIHVDLSIVKVDEYLPNMKVILSNSNISKKVYLIISDNNKDKGIVSTFKSSLKIKFNEVKIKKLMCKDLNLCESISQYILIDNNKVQAVLPFPLLRKYYRRSWKLTSTSSFDAVTRMLRYVFIKYIPINMFSNLLIVYECEK